MKGRAATQALSSDKWRSINQWMKDARCGILAIQETHLNADMVDSLHRMYGKQILIINSTPEGRETSAQGTALVINKQIVNTTDM